MELAMGVHLHVIRSDKFKDIGISVRFLAPLEAKSATIRSLLAVMMCDRCDRYPTKKAMSDVQDGLYGTSLHAQTIGYGKAHVVEIRSRVIDPIYVDDKQEILTDVFDFLKEVIFHPLVSEETLLESKSVLKAKLTRMHDNPSHYASDQGLKIGGEGTPLAISSLGNIEILEALTLEDVLDELQIMLHENRIDILVCGRCDENIIQNEVKKAFAFTERNGSFETHYTMQKDTASELVHEYRDITQSSVFLLWSTHMDMLDDHYYALRLGCAMFGQNSSSLLFQEVREKHSLCYSIYANLISFDGALVVSTGVEKANVEQAIALIQKQFERVCEGDFDNALLSTSKSLMINSLVATKDSMPSLMAQYYQNAVLDQSLSIDDRIALVKKVQKTEIMQAFQACSHQVTFVLSKEETDEEDHE